MRRLALLATTVVAIGAFPGLASAQKADCGLIKDHDMRRQCYAIRDRKPSDCGLISDSDSRRLCRAQAGARG